MPRVASLLIGHGKGANPVHPERVEGRPGLSANGSHNVSAGSTSAGRWARARSRYAVPAGADDSCAGRGLCNRGGCACEHAVTAFLL